MARGRVRKVLRVGGKAVLYALTAVSFVAMVGVAVEWSRSARGKCDTLSVQRSVTLLPQYSKRDWWVGSRPGTLLLGTAETSGRLSAYPTAGSQSTMAPALPTAGVEWSKDWNVEQDSQFELGSVEQSWRNRAGATVRRWGQLMWIGAQEKFGAIGRSPSLYLQPATIGTAVLYLPHWLAILVTAILPARGALRINRWRVQRKHRAAGICKGCGYDLRATPRMCPECGLDVAGDRAV